MERFFSRKNIERYRRMVENPRDEVQRRTILKLLADEAAKLKEPVPASRIRPPQLAARGSGSETEGSLSDFNRHSCETPESHPRIDD
jgi:hypothetical protein